MEKDLLNEERFLGTNFKGSNIQGKVTPSRINAQGFVELTGAEYTAFTDKVLGTIRDATDSDSGVQEVSIVSGEPVEFKTRGVIDKRMTDIWEDDDFNFFLTTLVNKVTNSRPTLPPRVDYTSKAADGTNQTVVQKAYLDVFFYQALMSDKDMSYDFSVSLHQKTLRIHAASMYNPKSQSPRKEKMAFEIRIIPNEIPKWEDLNLPSLFDQVTQLKTGLIIIAGHTGSGKSTTVASALNRINLSADQRSSILTVEEPVEYVYKSSESRILQRQVGTNVSSYTKATEDALRENVDVVMVGEMRNSEEMDNVLRLVEVGKMVLTTVHSNSVADTIDRIVNSFPGDIQNNVRARLAENVVCIIHQNLPIIETVKNGKPTTIQVPSVEGFLVSNSNEKSQLRKGFSRESIETIMQGANPWVISRQTAYDELVSKKIIEPTEENHAKLVPTM